MKKMFNKAVLNGTTVMGDGLTYPRIPNVYTGGNEGGYQRGDMMDANAVVEMIKELTDTGEITIDELQNLINEEIQERVEGDQNQQRYTDQKIKDLIGTSPETLDTLKEIADALGEDPDFAANVWNKIAELTTKHNEDVQELQDAITSGFENIDFTPYVKKTDVVTDTTNGLMLASDKTRLDAFKRADRYERAINLPMSVLGYEGISPALKLESRVYGLYLSYKQFNLNDSGFCMDRSVEFPRATHDKPGIMSSSDKTKLDSLVNYQAGNGIDITGDTISCTLDTSLYSIVTELPETGLPNKIYLLPSTKTEEGNIYTEYGYVDNKWEEIGKYKADVNLEPYKRALHLPSDVVKALGVQSGANYVNVYSYKEDLDRGILSEVSEFDIPKATSENAGIITAQDKAKLDAIENSAQVNKIESVSVNGTSLDITNKGVDIPLVNPNSAGLMSWDIFNNMQNHSALFDLNIERGYTKMQIVKKFYNFVSGYIHTSNTLIDEATTKLAGVMSVPDKQKLDGIEAGAQVNTIESVSVNSTPLEITDKGVNIPNATTSKDGMMSKTDKTKLDSLKNYTLPAATTTTLGGVKVPTTLSLMGSITGNHLGIDSEGELGLAYSLSYRRDSKQLRLEYLNGTKGTYDIASTIDCTDFIKDGMLESANVIVNPEGQKAGTYIKLVFNTDAGKDPVYINVSDLIHEYTAGDGINIADGVISTTPISIKTENFSFVNSGSHQPTYNYSGVTIYDDRYISGTKYGIAFDEADIKPRNTITSPDGIKTVCFALDNNVRRKIDSIDGKEDRLNFKSTSYLTYSRSGSHTNIDIKDDIKTLIDSISGKQDALTEVQLNNINNAITSISVNNIEQVNTNGAVNLTIPNASITENGLMSKEDKTKLDSQPTIKASNATGVIDDDYVVIKKSEYQSILNRLSALENKA